jgi:hypothetical protein
MKTAIPRLRANQTANISIKIRIGISCRFKRFWVIVGSQRRRPGAGKPLWRFPFAYALATSAAPGLTRLAWPAVGKFHALRHNGQPWESEQQLQKQSSHFLAKLSKEGVVEPGLTLHGLRVTFAAEINRVTGANDDQIAAAVGDRDARMGAHYTRHVEQEARSLPTS